MIDSGRSGRMSAGHATRSVGTGSAPRAADSSTENANSSEADSRDCVKLLKEQLLPMCKMFGYCQVASAYGSGNFINVLHEHLRGHEKVLTSRVNSKDDIYDSIKTFFGKGH